MTLLERDAELAVLDDAVAAAAAGSGGLLVIRGPAGIGKSGLLAALRERAAPSLRVLAARAGELEREFPYGVVRQLFEAAVAERGTPAGAAAPAAAVLGAAPEEEAGATFAALHGLYWLTLDLAAQRPLLLAIDDLHWSDRASLRFLAYLARRLEGAPVLAAATLRSSDPGTDPALIAELLADPGTRALEPGPLGRDAVAALVRERLGAEADPAFSAACERATGGNPLLLRQLLRTLEAEGIAPSADRVDAVRAVGPRAVSSTVLLRLARLPAAAGAAARAVAVLGEAAELPLVAALAELDEAAVASAAGDLVRVEILRPEPPLGFVHPLVREAVYRELPPGERELAHERAARALAAAGAPDDQVAAQLLQAPRRGDPWTVERLVAAARAASGRGAAESAVAYLRRALDEPPPEEARPGVQLALGRAEALSNGPAAAEHLRAAYEVIADPVTRARIALGLVLTLMFTDRAPEAIAVAREAADGVRGELPDLALELEALELGATFFGAPADDRAERLTPFRTAPPHGATGAASMAAMATVEWAYGGGSAAETAALGLAALRAADLFGADRGPVGFGATLIMTIAEHPDVTGMLEGALAASRARASGFGVSAAVMWLNFAKLWQGDLAGALELNEQSRELLHDWGVSRTAALAQVAFGADAHIARGDVAAARQAIDQGRDPGNDSDSARWYLLSVLRVLVAEGRAEEALALADEIASRFAGVVNPAANGWRGLAADALARLGRTDEALGRAEEQLELARAWGAPGMLAAALRRLGVLRDDLGLLEEAVASGARSSARLAHAQALAALGTALRHRRRPAEAREPLRRALELATACDAAALTEQVRTELYATGARPRTDALAGVGALTASERRVADLAAAGETNRDIAQALFVTPKTVEVHLSNAYRKLGIRSRRELESALA